MKSVLVIHPRVIPRGGGEAVAAWVIEALKDTTELSVLCWEPVDCAGVNRHYGTSLRPDELRVKLVPSRMRRLAEALPATGAMLELNLLQRSCKRHLRKHAYDVVMSTCNEMDFGCAGIQYVHFPWAYLPRPIQDMRRYHRIPGALRAYRFMCTRIGRLSMDRLRANLTLVNSDFIAERVRQAHGISSVTVYPPVPGTFPDVPWEQREQAFAWIGRIHPEKRLDELIDIVDGVRQRGRRIGLTLIGTPADTDYLIALRALVERHRRWITLHLKPPRDELLRIIARHRYGIHAMREEHFGIAVAELQRAGCVTFAHNSGGPAEVVGRQPWLLFDSAPDAIEKIVRVLGDGELLAELRAHVTQRGHLFSSDRFVREIRSIVAGFQGKQGKASSGPGT